MLHRFPFRAMASPCELQLHGEHASAPLVERAARAAIAEVARIEAKYSRYRDDSVTSAINRSAGDPMGFRTDAETRAMLDYAQTAFVQSDGLFDVTSGVLREVWDFRSGVLPRAADVERVLERVGWQRVRWVDGVIALPAGMQIDFGGFGKEYAADLAAQVCRRHGVRSGLVDLGGDIRIVGPQPDGSPWTLGVRDPRRAQAALATIALREGAIATSGDYQRCIVVGGRRYSHILDPRTGWPVEGLASVSVVASHCLIAGSATTIAMLKGEDGGAWLDALGLPNLRVDARGEVGGTLSRYGVAPASAATSGREPSIRSAGGVASAVVPGSTTT